MNPKSCPTCHAPIPESAPGGFCPACLLRDAEEIPHSSARAAPSLEEIAAAFPQWEIVRLIGQGGMGFVYQARQPSLDRTVALKILSPELGRDPAFAERFAREARTLGKLHHPNIVTVFEHGESGGYFYLLMEYVDGVNLRQAMRAGRFTPEQALALVPPICDALQAAHAQGVWHRDIKPENILLDTRGGVKIADFGIARLVGDPHRDFTLTITGGALGSAAYMAPEQHENPRNVDHRADIYSLGVVIYEMLTGELPLGRFPAPSQRAAVNARIDEIVFRTLEKVREMRQQSAEEVKTEVEGVKKISSSPESKISKISVGLPWSTLIPLLLLCLGVLMLIAFTLSTESHIAQYYWRKLWDPIDNRAMSLNLDSLIYRQFLNLWFGSGLLLTVGGIVSGLKILYRIKKGIQSAAGWRLLRNFILWPCVLAIPVTVLIKANDGMNPLTFDRWEIWCAHWIVYAATLFTAGLLFFIGSPPAGARSPTKRLRIVAASISVLLMFVGSFVAKKLADDWTARNFPFELSWKLDSLKPTDEAALWDALVRTSASFGGEPVQIENDGHRTAVVRFIIQNQRLFTAYRNEFYLRLKATTPGHEYGPGEYATMVWWDAKSAMRWPLVLMVMSTILGAITAAWSGHLCGRIAVISGIGASALMLALPAWPIPDAIARQILHGAPPAPDQSDVFDFSESTLAVQSVFDAAYLGNEPVVRAGMSKRLLGKLSDPADFQTAMKLLGNRWLVTNSSGDDHVWIRNGSDANARNDGLVDIVKEDDGWKLDQLPQR